MKSTIQHFRVDRREIYYLKFILEACDGIAGLSTVNSDLGVIALSIPPGCESDVACIMNGLREEMRIELWS